MSAQPNSDRLLRQVCDEMSAECQQRQHEMMLACMQELGAEDDRLEEDED